MNFFNAIWSAIKSLFCLLMGKENQEHGIAAESRAIAAIFLPLMGLAAGLVAALALRIFQSLFSLELLALAGLAVLTVLGGYRRLASTSRLFNEKDRAAGAAVAAVLVLLFEAFALIELGSVWGFSVMLSAVVFLPVAASVSLLSAASAQRESDATGTFLPGVKGMHMLLSALLAFVLMLPVFGLRAFIFAAVAVLAGAITAAAMQKREAKEEAATVAAVVSELLFLIVLMLFQGQSIIYY
jgi:cobalamin synthase